MTPPIISTATTLTASPFGTPRAVSPVAATQIAFPTVAAAVVPFAVGLLVVLGLIWAVRRGIRARRGEPGPPDPAEQPRLPATGPVREEQRTREPDDDPRA
ncbi:DUF6479 family protein [Streptomyces griseoviridis]